jgi:hypothetical protein
LYVGSTTAATLPNDNPAGIAIDASGNLYLGYKYNKPRKIDAATQAITQLGAGCTFDGTTAVGDGGAISTFKFARTAGITFDKVNNVLYLADSKSFRVRKLDFTSDLVSTYVGNGTPGTAPLTDDVAATSTSTLNSFVGLSVDKAGNLYIIDKTGGKIRKVDYITKVISSVVTGLSGGNMSELFVNPNAQEYYTTNKFNGNAVLKTTGDVALHVPGAPGSLATSALGSTTATLTWTASGTTGETYEIFKDGNSIGTTANGVLTYDATVLTPGATYSFVVKSVLSTYNASTSPLSVTTTGGSASAPGAPTITLVDAGGNVSFDAPVSDGGSAITGYVVNTYEAAVLKGSTVIALPSSPYTINAASLVKDHLYTFTVTATNAIGTSVESTPSTEITASISTAVYNMELNAAIIAKTSNGIAIQLNGMSSIELYSANGSLIEKTKTAGTYSRSLNNGMYIICINGKASKFVK